ncbi:MAG: enoyl-CoA hydratase/isomerase family protein [Pseudomonadota bacterium]
MTDTVLYQRDGHVGRLTLNDPQRHNALGNEQLSAITRYLDEINADDGVRVLVVTGSGHKTFCAGASLKELGASEIRDATFQTMTTQLAALPIPTICALNGSVFGGGVELAVSCDFRVGVRGARMRVPAAALGLCYPPVGIQRFVQCLGVPITRRLLVAAEEFDDEGMLNIGLLDQLVAPEALEEVVSEMAAQIAGLAPLAVQSMNALLDQSASGGMDEEQARALTELCVESTDLQEGFAAQREKRMPVFKGC